METKCKLSDKNHNFNTQTKFILIQQYATSTKKQKKERLKQRENFWILTLQTLTPKGLNQELN